MDRLLKNFQDTESPVEWLSNQTYELFEQYSEGNFNRRILNSLMLEATKKAKQKEVELMQKTIDRTLLVYKELKRD